MSKSNIEWTEETWNPIVGCSIVSPGCTNCYAMKDAWRKHHNPKLPHYHGLTKNVNDNPVWTGIVRQAPEHILLAPLKRRAPTMWFVNSMSDLFHEDIPDEWIDQVFAVMALCPRHTFQVLTKRAERMKSYVTLWFMRLAENAQIFPHPAGPTKTHALFDWAVMPSVLPNVWLGVSCERQKEADERIPLLLQTPAAVRFISAEPLLESIYLRRTAAIAHGLRFRALPPVGSIDGTGPHLGPHLDWVIVGGESSPRARTFDVAWADQIVEQCREAGVACFVKQLGSAPISDGYPLELKSKKGGDWNEWPERLRVREMPQTAALRSPVAPAPRNAEAVVP